MLSIRSQSPFFQRSIVCGELINLGDVELKSSTQELMELQVSKERLLTSYTFATSGAMAAALGGNYILSKMKVTHFFLIPYNLGKGSQSCTLEQWQLFCDICTKYKQKVSRLGWSRGLIQCNNGYEVYLFTYSLITPFCRNGTNRNVRASFAKTSAYLFEFPSIRAVSHDFFRSCPSVSYHVASHLVLSLSLLRSLSGIQPDAVLAVCSVLEGLFANTHLSAW